MRMAPVLAPVKNDPKTCPSVLVVDDEPMLMEMMNDIVGPQVKCRFVAARDIGEAKRILASQPIQLMLADVNLPDGDGMSLLSVLREQQPEASAIVITGEPTLERAIGAIRAGAWDFMPKPFNAQQMTDRVKTALQRQALLSRKEKRLDRLKDAVRRLNDARKVVSRKVDLLCNDLVTAYGELSKQLEDVRTQDSFRKVLSQARDLEQMLCHAMDWLLRQVGYSNIAIWLAADPNDFQLGAYMKYTTPGDRQLTEAMRNGLIPMTNRKGFVHLSAEEARAVLTPAELQHLTGQTLMSVNCTYLGEGLGMITLFRDESRPFTDEDAAALKSIAPIFANLLASVVKDQEEYDAETQAEYDDEARDDEDEEPRKKRDKKDSADWWKRGEPPPF